MVAEAWAERRPAPKSEDALENVGLFVDAIE